jgi:hypothetical protein
VWKFWFFLVLFFCQVWLQHLSKIFDLRSSHCLLLPSGHHLGSGPIPQRTVARCHLKKGPPD